MLKQINSPRSQEKEVPAGDERIHLFSDFTLDLARGCLLSAGEPVHLRPQAYEVLKYLVENMGRLVSKDKLIETVWRGRAVTDDALVQCLMEVRHALGEKGKRYIRNVRGRGYIFDPEGDVNGPAVSEPRHMVVVAESDSEASFQQKLTPNKSQAGASTGSSEEDAAFVELEESATSERFGRGASARHAISNLERHKQEALILSLVAVVGVVFAGFVYSRYSANPSPQITSIAVLPFANASGDQNLEYLSDGLSENLIDRLSQLPGIKVIARSSSFKYKGTDFDLREVANALGVQAVVMGRVMQRGDELQVRAELIDSRAGTQLWGEQYVRKAADIQAVQEEIARTISEKLLLRLSGPQQQQITKHATEDSQAYQFYLNGLFLQRQGGVENVRRALDYYEQAVALDPNFALAWVGVADATSLFAGNSWQDPKEANAKSKAAAQTALGLDEALAEAHVALGRIKWGEWDWAGAESEYKRALELNPNLVDAHNWYSSYLSTMERHDEALAEIQRAQALDPLSIGLRRKEAWVLSIARRYPEALEKIQQANKIEQARTPGALRGLAFIYESNRMYQQAIDEHQKANSIEGETTSGQCYIGYVLAEAGRREEALDILKKLKATKQYVSPTELAGLYVTLDDNESAIAMLERAYREHDLQLQTLKIDPHFFNLRTDPRFQDLVRRVGLPQ